MLSVLVPVYNYNIVALVTHIHTQLQLNNIVFEIICFDDGSTTEIVNTNLNISNLDFANYIISKENHGRASARQLLAKKATYSWLLFVDADVMPKSELYIHNYLQHIDHGYEAIYGGFAYEKKPPKLEHKLRWSYGKRYEQILAKHRNKKPYKVIISANFMIKKSVFLNINSQIEQKGYGFDNFFGALLKANSIKVLHIDNEVYHLGIETSSTYLQKTEKAVDTLLSLHKANRIKTHQNSLLNLFIVLKQYKLHYLFSSVYKQFKGTITTNLLSKQPKIKLLQLYKISYMCYKDLRKV
ncbi:glycosyltransferase family 2 protein [uncultured Psychroserpens sp.]|uniref:glycosyltransferase family 2 protein n=1 Tax=uncultured Psychroserpens sp. TaxID=255436 RepID=UPI00262F20A2|nr:glycosyltransferase family 2 protein [uncultured Psychroserpens sp.]